MKTNHGNKQPPGNHTNKEDENQYKYKKPP